MKDRWCAQDQTGCWCAVKDYQLSIPGEFVEDVETICGNVIVAPKHVEEREPTCPYCVSITILKESE